MGTNSHLLNILKERDLMGVLKKYVRSDDDVEMKRFLDALSSINLDNVNILRYLLKRNNEGLQISRLAPLPFADIQKYEEVRSFSSLGFDMIRQGRVAFLIFSGGTATRLKEQFPDLKDFYQHRFGIDIGSDPQIPKGMLPISPVGHQTFISFFVEQILRLQYDTGAIINLIIMVSRSTENYIRKYFEENDYFGLLKKSVFFLRQHENPRLDPDGDIIFDGERIITTGDGHGGVYRALVESHLRDELIIRGVDSIVMFNVDNPLARFADPVRIGYHFATDADFMISAVERTDPQEKIGVVAEDKEEGNLRVVEYNLLDEEKRNARDESDNLLFSCGHINVNIVNLSVIDKKFPPIIYKDKKVSVRGRSVPTASLEWLNQNLVGVLDKKRVSILGLPRCQFFLPTKNVRGVDSIETTRDGLVRYFKGILDDSCKFSQSAVLDLSPVFISDENDRYRLRNLVMEEDSELYIRANFDTEKDRLILDKGILIERGARLQIICKQPYGKLEYDYIYNAVRFDPSTASLVTLRYPLRISAGVTVTLQIQERGSLTIQSREINNNTEIVVREGESRILE